MWCLRCGNFSLKQSHFSLEGIFLPHPPDFPPFFFSPSPICEGFRFDNRVPKTGTDQNVVGQQKVCTSLYFCVCACAQALICHEGGSTRISIIRGLRGPPHSYQLCCSSLSNPPCLQSNPVTPLSLHPYFSLDCRNSIPFPARSSPLTLSAYTHPYHYLLHCRYLAEQPEITSSDTSSVQIWASASIRHAVRYCHVTDRHVNAPSLKENRRQMSCRHLIQTCCMKMLP